MFPHLDFNGICKELFKQDSGPLDLENLMANLKGRILGNFTQATKDTKYIFIVLNLFCKEKSTLGSKASKSSEKESD